MDKKIKESTLNLIQHINRSKKDVGQCADRYMAISIMTEYIDDLTKKEYETLYKVSVDAYLHLIGTIYWLEDFVRIVSWRYSRNDFTLEELKQMELYQVVDMVETWMNDGGAVA